LYSVSDDELNDWYAERDAIREKVFTFAKTYLRWGHVRRIPINLVSAYVRCDLCNRPKAQANYVSWDRVLYCERHLRARNRKLTKTLKWRMKVREMDRIAREHQAAFKDL